MPTTLARKAKKRPKPLTEKAADPELRRYIYCITDCEEPEHFNCEAIGASADVHTVAHNGIAAVVSPSARDKYNIDRQNALAHQRVMEYVMAQGHTVLPVKFDTIAEAKNGMGPEDRIVQQVLVKRFDEVSSLLDTMSTRVEMGVKAIWPHVNVIFREIVDSNDQIRRLRNKISDRDRRAGKAPQGGVQFGTRVKLGEMVKKALEAKKEREQKALLDAIRDPILDFCKNKTFGDRMFANLALLLEKSQVKALDEKLDELADAGAERIKLKYVGPMPPSNFIELVITWDE